MRLYSKLRINLIEWNECLAQGERMGSWIMSFRSLVIRNFSAIVPSANVFEDPSKSLLWTLKSPDTITLDVCIICYICAFHFNDIFGKDVILLILDKHNCYREAHSEGKLRLHRDDEMRYANCSR